MNENDSRLLFAFVVGLIALLLWIALQFFFEQPAPLSPDEVRPAFFPTPSGAC